MNASIPAQRPPSIAPEALLCRALRGESTDWPQDADADFPSRLLEAGHRHGVTPLLHHLLHGTTAYSSWPVATRDTLARELRMQIALDLLQEQELIAVLAALAAAGVRPLLLKGTPLAYTHYPLSALRPRCDTDLLVEPAARARAERVLEQMGYRRFSAFAGVTYQWEYRKRGHPVDHILDVHWRINNSQAFAQALSHAELLDRAVPVPRLGVAARTLYPPHALLLALMHRAAHEEGSETGNRLIWLYDIHLLARTMATGDWEAFARLSVAKKMQPVCLDGFSRTRQALATAFPDDMMERLAAPSAGKISAADLLAGRWRFLLEDLRGLPNGRRRLLFLWEMGFPPADFMLVKYQTSRRWWLPWLYLRRAAASLCKFRQS